MIFNRQPAGSALALLADFHAVGGAFLSREGAFEGSRLDVKSSRGICHSRGLRVFTPFRSVARTTTCVPSKILRTNPSIDYCVSAPSERRINKG